MIVDDRDVTAMTRLLYEAHRLILSGASLAAMRERARSTLLELHARGWRHDGNDLGKAPHVAVKEFFPVVLYLASREDVDELEDAFKELKPNAVAVKLHN